MRKIAILLFLFLFSEVQPSLATHIVGGELYYRYLGNNNYQIHLRVYRDCFYGVPPFDQPASVGIFNANNVLVQQLFMNVNDSSTVPPIINSPCFIPPTNVCYRVANYYATVNLPFSPGGYQLAYQRCCRNQTILNIVSPLTTGATFYANIPASQPINSNPVFDSLPPPFVCAGLPLVFDHSATDSDGDSLVYEICNPYDGATQNNPQPQPPFNPPYANVVWNPPYNLSNLLGGIPMTIDPQTGLLTATPNTIGQFVIGVCVNEYRNGVLLSKTRRDYQLNVVPCPSLVVAALQSPSLQCGSPTVQFTNNSFGAGSYYWNFGDPGTLADTSLQVNPSYTYADTGLYNVTLIAYSAFNPGCADTTVGQIQILPDYEIDFNYTFNPCSYTVNFNDTSNTDSGPTVQWSWNFGDGGTATVTDPSHTYPGPGTYTVSLTTVSSRGCTETLNKTVVLPPFISAQINSTGTSCHDSCDATATVSIANGNDPFTYLWNDPQSQDSSTAVGLCPGSYQVSITDSNGCSTTAQVTINAPTPVNLSLSSTDAYCNGACIGTASALPSGGTPPYFYSWSDPQSQNTAVADGLCEGWYAVSMTDVNGCPVSDSVYVQFSNFIPAVDATVSADTIFAGQTINLSALTSGGPFSYSWTPPDSVSNPQLQNPTSSPVQPITYYVTIADSNGCENLDSVSVFVKEVFCEEPEIFIPNAFSPDGNGKNDKLYVRGNTIRELTLKIFDRWGELVFETNDPSIGWDGTYKGKLSAPAVYVYWLEATCYNDEKFFKKGNITLIR